MSPSKAPALLLVGSGPGIGLATALLFARRKFPKVALISRSAERLATEAETIKSSVTDRDVSVNTWAVDITDSERYKAILLEVGEWGDVTCVVFNAARVQPSTLLEEPESEIVEDFKARPLLSGRRLNLSTDQQSAAEAPSLLVTSSLLWRDPYPAFFSLSMVKSSQRNLVQSLGLSFPAVHCALLNVGGQVRADDEFLNPTSIAEKFWELYEQKEGAWALDMDVLGEYRHDVAPRRETKNGQPDSFGEWVEGTKRTAVFVDSSVGRGKRRVLTTLVRGRGRGMVERLRAGPCWWRQHPAMVMMPARKHGRLHIHQQRRVVVDDRVANIAPERRSSCRARLTRARSCDGARRWEIAPPCLCLLLRDAGVGSREFVYLAYISRDGPGTGRAVRWHPPLLRTTAPSSKLQAERSALGSLPPTRREEFKGVAVRCCRAVGASGSLAPLSARRTGPLSSSKTSWERPSPFSGRRSGTVADRRTPSLSPIGRVSLPAQFRVSFVITGSS
ncbi:hypothetical protein B2J93_8363 [Marssonina coronariae]|uniref:Uncharacterized protein n=1 Tax=Diplocarpon coronariae TaxID=2795749 RepID=A0A218ZCU2_9HELO|nr:hypothetical protein B2J93_8363 [Marssonina coronariae]